jgi:D-amino-acid dehydrogenase
MSKVIIAGGGIVGLSSALFLRKSGHDVTVFDSTDIVNNCSYGNAGYVCPGHFVPLAQPRIIQQGMKLMMDPLGPFYIKPRLDRGLIDWGLKFMKKANLRHVEESAIPLRDIAIISKAMYEYWKNELQMNFFYKDTGLLDIFLTDGGMEHGYHMEERSKELGLDVVMLNERQLMEMEPDSGLEAKGAIYFKCDAHVDPVTVMTGLLEELKKMGVEFKTREGVKDFEFSGNKITKVITDKGRYETDAFVLSAGSWSRELAKKVGLNIPLVAGRGYSFIVEEEQLKFRHPAILNEGKVAITPMSNNKIRIGGTMEITTTTAAPRYQRVQGILNNLKRFIPSTKVSFPKQEDIWFGYRPCSADGLPYLGRNKKYNNCIIATGHSMIGMSLGAGTGKLVSELVNEEKTSMDLTPFDPARFD